MRLSLNGIGQAKVNGSVEIDDRKTGIWPFNNAEQSPMADGPFRGAVKGLRDALGFTFGGAMSAIGLRHGNRIATRHRTNNYNSNSIL
jgi:hypothetical protein